MIFVSVGTQDVNFDRLINGVINEIDKGNIKEEVLVQCGITNIKTDKVKLVNFIPSQEFEELLNNCSLFICHGGVGSIVGALKLGKTVIACPRLSEYKEHVNDHQKQIISRFNSEGYIIGIDNPEDLEEALVKAKTFKPKEFISNNENFVKLIENFIDNN